ncbi:TBC1 domain family member 12-like isoform X2 [Apostichopus japonicus]|uniref:TBC1 domain family member 12-like isoform X2 n=1 Tax=Stichopus japonicus TaxID=307972 RepID=UPI003AB783A1
MFLISRNPFRKSTKAANNTDTVPGVDPSWGSLSQTPPGSPGRSLQQIAEERQKKGQTHPPTSSNSWKNRKPGLTYASSTTALILENRPPHLPAKNPEEQQKHVLEYQEMIRGAKKKEVRDHKKQLKELEVRLRHEDGVQMHLQTWQDEILPNWETMKNNKKARDLWWQGIPPSVRGRVWMLAIGNELNITPELFEIFLLRARDRIKYISDLDSDGESEEAQAGSLEDSVDVIKLDIARTFPNLCIFQKGGPYYDYLHSVLGAYACYRPDVGYVQGMSFIAAVFLLYLSPPQAFHCFANLLNKSCQLAFFRLDQQVMHAYFATYEEYFQENMPRLYEHFQEQKLTPDIYIIDWMYTLYIKSMPLDVACVILDVFFRDGEEFLFRTALGILRHYEEVLLQLDFIQIAQFLSKLPSQLSSEDLFQSIEEIDMHNQKRFKEVLAGHLAQALTTNS